MNTTKMMVLLLGIILLSSTVSLAQNFRMKSRTKVTTKPVEVSTWSTLHVNCQYNVIWQGIPKSYKNVWLQICKASNKSSCGGAVAKSNTGGASYKTDTSMTNQNLVIKIYTQDKKYTGYSKNIFVDGMLMQCCPDGKTLPPCD